MLHFYVVCGVSYYTVIFTVVGCEAIVFRFPVTVSGKRAEVIVVSGGAGGLVVGDINTLYSRIIIRLLLNMDFKDIPNCFCSKFDLMHVKRKQNKTINAHFPFQLHATIHTHK